MLRFCVLFFLLALGGCYALERPSLKSYEAYDWPNRALENKSQKAVHVTYLGTTSLYFEDGETGILIDGFFTRPENLAQIAFGEIQSDMGLLQDYLQRLNIKKLAAIPVFHSHYDHAMDSAQLAQLTGAVMLGSNSTAMIGRGAHLPESQIQIVETGKAYHFGKFTLRFYPSQHVPLPGLVESTGVMGEITEPLSQPAAASAYREGETYAIVIEHPLGTSLLHSGSFVPGEIAGLKADVLFLATSGFPKLSAARRTQFIQEIVLDTQVKKLVPVHWGDFFRSLDRPMLALPRIAEDLDAAMSELQMQSQAGSRFKIQFLPVWQKRALFTQP